MRFRTLEITDHVRPMLPEACCKLFLPPRTSYSLAVRANTAAMMEKFAKCLWREFHSEAKKSEPVGSYEKNFWGFRIRT
jgi:hypothetical protein